MRAYHQRLSTTLLTVVLVVVLSGLVAACGGDEATTTTAGGAATDSTGSVPANGSDTSTTIASGGPTVTVPGGSIQELPETPPSVPGDQSGPPQPGAEYAARLPELEQAVDQSPEDLDALAELAIAYYQTQAYQKAEEVYLKMIGLEDSAEFHNNLGNVYRDWPKTDQAIEQYEEAIELDETLASAYGNLAVLYMMSGQIDKAIVVAEAGIEKTTGAGRQQLEALLLSLQ